MRIRVLSDLHVEEAPFVPPSADADVVVLAGDIANGAASLHWARTAFPGAAIVQVAGNHEFYDGEYHRVLDEMRAAARELGIVFLENDAAVVGGVRFLGCTFWTDFRLYEGAGRPIVHSRDEAMALCGRHLPDFGVIRWREGAAERGLAPADTAALHESSRRWLAATLAQSFDGPTVVVSHHLPSWRSVHARHGHWPTSAAFASDADALLARVDCWIHGHTHASWHYDVQGAKVVCNPRGYPGFAMRRMGMRPPAGANAAASGRMVDEGAPEPFENLAFDPALVIEVGPAAARRPLG